MKIGTAKGHLSVFAYKEIIIKITILANHIIFVTNSGQLCL